ncbi:MAG: RES domain-containing protein [Actinomycetota bacterium]|nr:RES domain-containing protein [Actinomycetota bacterium]
MGEPGPSRFDDPAGLFVVRYLATHLQGCMIELLARFRDNEAADNRVAQVQNVEPEDVALDADGAESKAEGIRVYLAKQSVVRVYVAGEVPIVRINDAATLGHLNTHPLVRSALDASGLGTPQGPAELDGGTIRLKGEAGRMITQAVSRAVYEGDARPGGLRYFSRLDDTQECWALFDRVTVEFENQQQLTSEDPDHRAATARAATTLSVELPREWTDPPEASR